MEWAPPPRELSLPYDEVHVWRATLDIADADFGRLTADLSPEERIRASRYRFSFDVRTSMLARAILRQILCRYLGTAAAELSFTYGAHGKPALANCEAEWLQFNVSHSGDLALYAIAREREVGVDLERVNPALASWQLASAFFAEGEVRALRDAGDELRSEAFFACWTRKEAYLKARGSGLSAALDNFEVPLTNQAVVHRPVPLVAGDMGWSVQSLDVRDGMAGACAAQGSNWRVCQWQWNSEDAALNPQIPLSA